MSADLYISSIDIRKSPAQVAKQSVLLTKLRAHPPFALVHFSHSILQHVNICPRSKLCGSVLVTPIASRLRIHVSRLHACSTPPCFSLITHYRTHTCKLKQNMCTYLPSLSSLVKTYLPKSSSIPFHWIEFIHSSLQTYLGVVILYLTGWSSRKGCI